MIHNTDLSQKKEKINLILAAFLATHEGNGQYILFWFLGPESRVQMIWTLDPEIPRNQCHNKISLLQYKIYKLSLRAIQLDTTLCLCLCLCLCHNTTQHNTTQRTVKSCFIFIFTLSKRRTGVRTCFSRGLIRSSIARTSSA